MICSFLMPKPTGTSLEAPHSRPSCSTARTNFSSSARSVSSSQGFTSSTIMLLLSFAFSTPRALAFSITAILAAFSSSVSSPNRSSSSSSSSSTAAGLAGAAAAAGAPEEAADAAPPTETPTALPGKLGTWVVDASGRVLQASVLRRCRPKPWRPYLEPSRALMCAYHRAVCGALGAPLMATYTARSSRLAWYLTTDAASRAGASGAGAEKQRAGGPPHTQLIATESVAPAPRYWCRGGALLRCCRLARGRRVGPHTGGRTTDKPRCCWDAPRDIAPGGQVLVQGGQTRGAGDVEAEGGHTACEGAENVLRGRQRVILGRSAAACVCA